MYANNIKLLIRWCAHTGIVKWSELNEIDLWAHTDLTAGKHGNALCIFDDANFRNKLLTATDSGFVCVCEEFRFEEKTFSFNYQDFHWYFLFFAGEWVSVVMENLKQIQKKNMWGKRRRKDENRKWRWCIAC